MRISTRAFINHLSANLTRASEEIARLGMQISSGRRLTRPSDDPLAVGAVVDARADVARLANRQKVLAKAARLTAVADTALDTMSSMLRRAAEVAVSATRPGTEPAARSALAAELRSIGRTIVDEGNSSITGEYVFAGKLSEGAPFQEAGGAVTYHGSSEGMVVWVAPGRAMEVTIPGDRLFNFENAAGERAVPEVDRDLFTLIDEMAGAIEAGDDDAVREMMPGLEALTEHAIHMRGLLGARAARIEDASNAAANAELRATELLAETEGVDLVEALVELENQKLAYQSALAATARLAQLPTLFELQW